MKIDRLAMVHSVHMSRIETLSWKVKKRKEGKRTWEREVEEQSENIGLRVEDVLCKLKLIVGFNQIDSRFM